MTADWWRKSLTVWPVALAIAFLSGFPAVLLMLVGPAVADLIGWAVLIMVVAAPVLGIGYLAAVLTERWLRRTVMTLIVGGLLASLLIEVADGFVNGWSGRAYPMCNHSILPELTVFIAAVLLLAAGLRCLTRRRAR